MMHEHIFFVFIIYLYEALSCRVIYCEEHLNILSLESEDKSTHKVDHESFIHSFFWETNKYKEI